MIVNVLEDDLVRSVIGMAHESLVNWDSSKERASSSGGVFRAVLSSLSRIRQFEKFWLQLPAQTGKFFKGGIGNTLSSGVNPISVNGSPTIRGTTKGRRKLFTFVTTGRTAAALTRGFSSSGEAMRG